MKHERILMHICMCVCMYLHLPTRRDNTVGSEPDHSRSLSLTAYIVNNCRYDTIRSVYAAIDLAEVQI